MTQFVNSLLRRSADVLRLLRRSPDGEQNNQSLSHRRYRLAAFTGISTLFSRAASFAVAILTVRFTFRYLGAERYGMWMTITSLVTMFGFADLGMGNGLINIVAESIGKDRINDAKRATSSAFWILCIVAAILLLSYAAIYPHLNIPAIFNVQSPLAIREAGPALTVFAVLFLLQISLGVVRGTQFGLQKGFVNTIWVTLGVLLSLVALLIAIHLHLGLPMLVLSIAGPPLLITIVNGVELFFVSHPELRPSLQYFSSVTAREVLQTGLMYFILQLSISIGVQTDNIVIAQIMGSEAVAGYAVPARMFNLVTSFLVMLSGVMLPAYADAFARQDGLWIKKAFRRVCITGTLIATVAAAILVSWGNPILHLWVGPQLSSSFALLLTFGVLSIVNAYLQPINFLLNGVRAFKIPVICAIVYAVVNLGMSILLVRQFGIVGAVLGTLIATILVQMIPLTIAARGTLAQLTAPQHIQHPTPPQPGRP